MKGPIHFNFGCFFYVVNPVDRSNLVVAQRVSREKLSDSNNGGKAYHEEFMAVFAVFVVILEHLFFWKENAMSKLAFAVLGSIVAMSALAQDGAVKMTREQLLSFLPGTKVTHINSGGSERHWTNEPDGTLYATSNNKIFGSGTGSAVYGHAGTWKVNEEGKYCFDVDWKTVSEKWCATILKGDGDTYYLGKVDEKRKIVFAK